MLLNKKVFYFSFIISLISLLLSIFFHFYYNNEITEFICNILLNVFAGTIVLIVTSLFDYFIQKRRILNAIMEKIHKFRNVFNGIKYLDDIKNYPSYEDNKKYYESKKVDDKFEYTEEMYNKQKEGEMKKITKKMNKIIDKYIELSKIDYNDMWLLYDELYFINPLEKKNKKRQWFYTNVFNYIYQLLNEVRVSAYYFELYKESNKFKNECYQTLLELQNKIFYFEKLYGEDYNWHYDLKDEYPIYSGFSAIDDSHFIVSNKVVDYLSEIFEVIRKINK